MSSFIGMDSVLKDIKSFLLKLESGQLEIEAGQWQLHKDMERMKKTFEELKKMKQDVDDMRVTNAEQLGIMRDLEEKMEYIQNLNRGGEAENHHGSKCFHGTSEHSDDSEEKAHGQSCSETNATDKSTCHKAEDEGSCPHGEAAHVHHPFSHSDGHENCQSAPQYMTRKPDGEILQRYLKDSAKYNGSSHSTNHSCRAQSEGRGQDEDDDRSTNRIGQSEYYYNRDGTGNGNRNFWDEYSRQTVQSRTYDVTSEERSQGEECDRLERNPVEKWEKRHKSRANRQNRKESKNLNRGRRRYTRDKSRVATDFNCKYCHKSCRNLRELKWHSRKCRSLVRAHYKRKLPLM